MDVQKSEGERERDRETERTRLFEYEWIKVFGTVISLDGLTHNRISCLLHQCLSLSVILLNAHCAALSIHVFWFCVNQTGKD